MSEETTIFKCADCDFESETSKAFKVIHTGEHVCGDCLDNYEYCDDTGEYHHVDDCMYIDSKDIWVTIDEYQNNYFTCDDCGEIYHNNDNHAAHDSRGRDINICTTCRDDNDYFTCDDCGEIFHTDQMNSVNDGNNHVCESCCSDNYVWDDRRETYVSPDDLSSDKSDLIESYSYTPHLEFKGKKDYSSTNPFFGFELEVECPDDNRNDMASYLNDVYNYAENYLYFKEDGSLDNGVEIVSHPATMSEHLKRLKESDFIELSKLGAKSFDTKTCGLHFHISKEFMTDAHKVRFGLLFAMLREPFEVLAQRKASTYAKFKSKNLARSQYKKSDERYEAVNWTNKKTVEIRMFKGTLKFSTFIASMQLCHAAYLFTHSRHSLACKMTTQDIWLRFIAWIAKKPEAYKELLAYIEHKKERINKALNNDSQVFEE
jgi:hypothetical protein